MSLIWQHRAQLVTPWNPGFESPMFDYQGDYVRIYTAAQADRWLDQAKSGDTNRVPAQNTQAAMPTWALDADFRGHGALTFGAGISMSTGVFSAALAHPVTYYAVGKWGSAGVIEFLFDGLDATHRQAIYSGADGNNHGYAGSDITGIGTKNSLFLYCLVVNGASSSLYRNNMTTALTSGNIGAQVAAGLRIGTDSSITYFLNGKLCQLTGYAGAHSVALRTRIGKYYGDKYGQVVT